MTRSEAIARLRRKPPVPPEERERFVGVTNAYLEHRLALLGLHESVEGTPELLKPCPCCELRTLDGEAYDICRVCFWATAITVLSERRVRPSSALAPFAKNWWRTFSQMVANDTRARTSRWLTQRSNVRRKRRTQRSN